MKKMGILVIIGIIFSVFGLAIMVVSGVYAARDYEKYAKYSEGKVEIKDVDYSFTFDYGKINVYSTTEASYVDYKINSFYKIIDEEGSFRVESTFNFFEFLFGNKNEINVYLNENVIDNKLAFKLNAGTFNSNIDLSCKELDIKLNAGAIVFNNVSCDKLTMKTNAGELKILNSTVDSINSELNAGSINVKSTFNDMTFKVNAGSMNVKTVGELADYTIAIDKSAGSSNVSNGGSGEKKINGKINAGSFNLTFNN